MYLFAMSLWDLSRLGCLACFTRDGSCSLLYETFGSNHVLPKKSQWDWEQWNFMRLMTSQYKHKLWVLGGLKYSTVCPGNCLPKTNSCITLSLGQIEYRYSLSSSPPPPPSSSPSSYTFTPRVYNEIYHWFTVGIVYTNVGAHNWMLKCFVQTVL